MDARPKFIWIPASLTANGSLINNAAAPRDLTQSEFSISAESDFSRINIPSRKVTIAAPERTGTSPSKQRTWPYTVNPQSNRRPQGVFTSMQDIQTRRPKTLSRVNSTPTPPSFQTPIPRNQCRCPHPPNPSTIPASRNPPNNNPEITHVAKVSPQRSPRPPTT